MIGRKREIELLQEAIEKPRAQFITIYGRRRVGKTFLVNEFFQNKYTFKHTAISPFEDKNKKFKRNILKLQLQEFHYSLRNFGLPPEEPIPTNWFAAFHLLQNLLERKDDGSNLVIFIDELPWMDTPRSNFMSAFEHFANDWVLARKNARLVVCGSATSWILDKLLNNQGGI